MERRGNYLGAAKRRPHWAVWIAIPLLYAIHCGLYDLHELYVNAAAFLHSR
jgi:hypothetical protein